MNADRGATLSFDIGRAGRRGVALPAADVPAASPLPPSLLRDDLTLPEMSQLDVVRYFTRLSQLNYSVDTGFYPLGSCTMKYNPAVDEALAALPGFAAAHPLQPPETLDGALALMFDLQRLLCEISGMDAASLAPMAGAQGELTGILVGRAWHESRGDRRQVVLVPDSAHGTNPATAAMAGYRVVSVASNERGDMDLAALERALDEGDGQVAALMLTLPNTLGLFEPNICRIGELVHSHGALLYGDGANMNALLGRAKFGDLGFDVLHMNLHKTFSTPHGGGGPGSGPIAVKAHLAPFLPAPVVRRQDGGGYELAQPERSIGRLGAFFGNFGMMVRAWAYIRSLGPEGLWEVSGAAVLNANYLLSRLRGAYRLPYDRRCMHEAVFSGSRQRAKGARTLDIAKRLIDYGFHPPTIYFPLIVEEALMIEPTETESKETIDAFCDAMLAIAREAETDPDLLHAAPHDAPVGRLDEATAARHPVLTWRQGQKAKAAAPPQEAPR